MAVSKAQQKAVNKYMAANYDRINLTVPKGRKEKIRDFAAATGESVNRFINRAIGESMGECRCNALSVTEIPQGELTPEALQKAQEAAKRTGETVSSFIERAVVTQAQRDKVAQSLSRAKE